MQVSAVQKLETKQIQLRETYERQKMDVQNLTVEKKQLEKHLDTKVSFLEKWFWFLPNLFTFLNVVLSDSYFSTFCWTICLFICLMF